MHPRVSIAAEGAGAPAPRPCAPRPPNLFISDAVALRCLALRSLLRLSIESVRCSRLWTWRFRCCAKA
jgi:hypothetical protein